MEGNYKATFGTESLEEFDGHELVNFFYNKTTGLKGFLAIHNTALGPAIGGTRYWPYGSQEEAMRDALRLSRAMTYKCALARVHFGGGKGVILADVRYPKNRAFISSYARVVNLLRGSFFTGEDVGIDKYDVEVMAKVSPFIIGRRGLAGDPGPWAALGVFYAIEAALESALGTSRIQGRTFAIKGLGKVGGELCHLLTERGGKVIGADIDPSKVRSARKRFPKIRIAPPGAIHKESVDVYCPCAMGGEFTEHTIRQLSCHIVCGAANNQLSSPACGDLLRRAGVIYVPDYVANAGGLINVAGELDKRGYSRARVYRKMRGIKKTVRKILELSAKRRQPANRVADTLAERIFLRRSKKRI